MFNQILTFLAATVAVSATAAPVVCTRDAMASHTAPAVCEPIQKRLAGAAFQSVTINDDLNAQRLPNLIDSFGGWVACFKNSDDPSCAQITPQMQLGEVVVLTKTNLAALADAQAGNPYKIVTIFSNRDEPAQLPASVTCKREDFTSGKGAAVCGRVAPWLIGAAFEAITINTAPNAPRLPAQFDGFTVGYMQSGILQGVPVTLAADVLPGVLHTFTETTARKVHAAGLAGCKAGGPCTGALVVASVANNAAELVK